MGTERSSFFQLRAIVCSQFLAMVFNTNEWSQALALIKIPRIFSFKRRVRTIWCHCYCIHLVLRTRKGYVTIEIRSKTAIRNSNDNYNEVAYLQCAGVARSNCSSVRAKKTPSCLLATGGPFPTAPPLLGNYLTGLVLFNWEWQW